MSAASAGGVARLLDPLGRRAENHAAVVAFEFDEAGGLLLPAGEVEGSVSQGW